MRSRMSAVLSLGIALAVQPAFSQPADVESSASPMRPAVRAKGYLIEDEYPDSSALLPPPPAPGSTALALDEELNKQTLRLRGTARWELAASDAIPDSGRAFSCAAVLPISEKNSPALYTLLRRSAADVGPVVTRTKKLHQRKRPFLINKQPTCVPRAEEVTAYDGSYPSGHTAAGWLWALILAELVPEKTDAILARGWEYGQSRAVCNVHYQSDVTAGRTVGSALVARLHANEEFRADLEAAREEVAKLSAEGLPPERDCEAEAAALAVK